MAGILLGETAAKQVRDTVRYVESLRGNDPAKGKHKHKPRGGNNKILVQLTANLTTGSSAAGVILYFNGSGFTSSGQTVTVWDQFSNPYLPSGARVWCELYGGAWVVTNFQDEVLGKLDGALSFGGSQTVSVWFGSSAGLEADTGENISGVGDWLLTSGYNLASGTYVIAERSTQSPWYVTAARACPTT